MSKQATWSRSGRDGEERADRREVVRLMQRRERDVALELCDHRPVDHDGTVVVRPAMHDPVADRGEVEALRLAQPGRHDAIAAGTSGTLSGA